MLTSRNPVENDVVTQIGYSSLPVLVQKGCPHLQTANDRVSRMLRVTPLSVVITRVSNRVVLYIGNHLLEGDPEM